MSEKKNPTVLGDDSSSKIRELEQELKKLRRNDLQYRILLMTMPSGILLEDENRAIIQANQLFCDLFGMSMTPDEMIGMDCSRSAEYSKHLFRHPEEFVRRIDELLFRREMVQAETLEMADGRILERDYIPLFIDGYYLGHLWRYTDVTEQRRLMERLDSIK